MPAGPLPPRVARGVELLVETVARTPDAVAVIGPTRSLTYRELRAMASAVATRAAELAPVGGVVAVLGPVDERTFAAIAGIQLAGRVSAALGVYDPPDVLAAIAAGASPAAVLVADGHAALAEAAFPDGPPLVPLDEVLAHPPAEPFDLVPVVLGTPSWLFFTSGTTGVPKAVAMPSRIGEGWPEAPMSPDDRAAVVESTFMANGQELAFQATAAGAAVAFYDLRERGAAGLPQWIADVGVTRFRGQTSVLRTLLDTIEPGAHHLLAGVRRWSVAGEPLRAADLERFAAVFAPGCALDMAYGFTQAPAVVAEWTFVAGEPLPEEMPGLRPAQRFEVAVVDEAGDPVEPGVVGELWGRRDGQTYRSGDLARVRPDGTFEIVGRLDDRVKVRGTNVHLLTVEDALSRLPDVRAAAVAAVPRPDGGNTLVAYVVPEQGRRPSVAALRQGLAATLPRAAVPSSFHLLLALPLTARGKVDRAALERNSVGLVPRDTEHLPPRDEVERRVHGLVADVLALDADEFGVLDDVFDLGADSLSVEELLARIRDSLGVALDVRSVIGGASVEALAREVRGGRSQRSSLVTRLSSQAEAVPLVLFGGSEEPAMSMVRLGRRLAGRHPVAIVQHPVIDGRPRPFRQVPRFAAAVAAELDGVVGTGPCVLVGHSFGGLVAYETAVRRSAAGRPAPTVVLLDTYCPDGRLASARRLLRDRWREARPGSAGDGAPGASTGPGTAAAASGESDGTARVATAEAAPRGRAGALGRRVAGSLGLRARVALHQVFGIGRLGPEHDAYALALATRMASARYRPGPPAGRLVLLRARRGPRELPPDLGWHGVAPDVEVRVVDGHHVGLVQEPYVAGVSAAIEEAIDEAVDEAVDEAIDEAIDEARGAAAPPA